MPERTSIVNQVNVHSLSLGSVLEIGDSNNVWTLANIWAIQREYPIFFGIEGSLDYYSTFRIPLLKANIYEKVNTTYINENPVIKVERLNIVGISAGSHVQIGSTKEIYAQGRVFNVRHFLNYPEDYPISEIHPTSQGIE